MQQSNLCLNSLSSMINYSKPCKGLKNNNPVCNTGKKITQYATDPARGRMFITVFNSPRFQSWVKYQNKISITVSTVSYLKYFIINDLLLQTLQGFNNNSPTCNVGDKNKHQFTYPAKCRILYLQPIYLTTFLLPSTISFNLHILPLYHQPVPASSYF